MSKGAGKNQTIAICAVLAAVIVGLNFLSSLHLIRLDAIFFLVSGALIYFVANRFGIRAGALLYIAASLLSFLIVPDKVWLLFFIGVFGPAALLQSGLDKRLNRILSAVITIAAFLALFYLFGFVAFYESGFIPRLNLPANIAIPGVILILGFAVLSAVVAFFVNRGLCEFLKRRMRGVLGRDSSKSAPRDQNMSIALPKLSQDDDESSDV